jgi:hypothetical protein
MTFLVFAIFFYDLPFFMESVERGNDEQEWRREKCQNEHLAII